SGNNIPLLYGHDFADPFSNIGVVTSAVEDDHGLKIEAVLDLDNEKAAQVHRLIKERRLSQMSFAFRVLDAADKAEYCVCPPAAAKLSKPSACPITPT
ncbi:HK97 family phage prohead protease, partial [Streptococcus anginosus]|uniref:HK97 family phage prohead protease n=1 Tax=Streptococcus anginosus TaxID=1328 RepID=UPI0021F8AB74